MRTPYGGVQLRAVVWGWLRAEAVLDDIEGRLAVRPGDETATEVAEEMMSMTLMLRSASGSMMRQRTPGRLGSSPPSTRIAAMSSVTVTEDSSETAMTSWWRMFSARSATDSST